MMEDYKHSVPKNPVVLSVNSKDNFYNYDTAYLYYNGDTAIFQVGRAGDVPDEFLVWTIARATMKQPTIIIDTETLREDLAKGGRLAVLFDRLGVSGVLYDLDDTGRYRTIANDEDGEAALKELNNRMDFDIWNPYIREDIEMWDATRYLYRDIGSDTPKWLDLGLSETSTDAEITSAVEDMVDKAAVNESIVFIDGLDGMESAIRDFFNIVREAA